MQMLLGPHPAPLRNPSTLLLLEFPIKTHWITKLDLSAVCHGFPSRVSRHVCPASPRNTFSIPLGLTRLAGGHSVMVGGLLKQQAVKVRGIKRETNSAYS